MLRPIILVLCTALLGCQGSREVTGPTPEADRVDIEIGISIAPSRYGGRGYGGLDISAQACNTGNVGVSYSGPFCGSPDMHFRFFDPWGREIRVSCGCEAKPACPAIMGMTLEPGNGSSGGALFDGRLWNGKEFVTGPAGDYRVTATFDYFVAGTRESISAEKTFSWGIGAREQMDRKDPWASTR
jgi:hypothetical protein